MNGPVDALLPAEIAARAEEAGVKKAGLDATRTFVLAVLAGAFIALGAAFSGLGGAFFAAKLQAIFPELFRFQVSIMLLCMVILGGMGNIPGVVLGGLLILLFDRVILAQATPLVRGLGDLLGVPALRTVDLQLWRWGFFGATLIIVMLLRPEGLFPKRQRAAELHGDGEVAGEKHVALGSP